MLAYSGLMSPCPTYINRAGRVTPVGAQVIHITPVPAMPSSVTRWNEHQPRRWSIYPAGLRLGPVYRTSLNLNVKVLDFVKSGGPKLTVGRTVFELWLGSL